MKQTMYLINHSHTDIGYTDRQEKIERYHVDFIKQSLEIFDMIENNKMEWKGYKWVCENYWQVENFWQNANDTEREKFIDYVKKGYIDISLTYLNMTELVDHNIQDVMLKKGREFADKIDFKGDSGMTADINGYSWGMVEALKNNGINNLFSCTHSHHGLQPIGNTQKPFWWESPLGKKILVWSGEHYMLGNEFLLIPNSRFTYRLNDNYKNDYISDANKVRKERIFNYVKNLKENGYQYNYFPVMVSGVLTDNAPANGAIMDEIKAWNDSYGDDIYIEMITLNDFFKIVNKEEDIPTFKGDWNDWWADGVGSTPASTKLYKDGVRKYRLSEKLKKKELDKVEHFKSDAEKNLMMYAEHTWGYSSSVSEPWNSLVIELEHRKASYATNGHISASKYLDEVLYNLGETSIIPNRNKIFKVINPHSSSYIGPVSLFVEHWEDIDGEFISDEILSRVSVENFTNGEVINCQVRNTARALEVVTNLNLKANSSIKLKIKLVDEIPYKVINHNLLGAEGIRDIKHGNVDAYPTLFWYENDLFIVEFEKEIGIKRIYSKLLEQNILHSEKMHAPFIGVYEKTESDVHPVEERRLLGRNRKGIHVKRKEAKMTNISIVADGPVYTIYDLEYSLAGTKMYVVSLQLFKETSRIETTIKLQKDIEWAPENLYVSLPFALENDYQGYLDKTGCIIRPGVDQLPLTNTEFYLSQNGLIYEDSDKNKLSINSIDAPLFVFGSLDAGLIELSGEETVEKHKKPAYSWLMNNYWETNFKVDLSGFYEFKFILNCYKNDSTENQVLLQNNDQGLVGFPIIEDKKVK